MVLPKYPIAKVVTGHFASWRYTSLYVALYVLIKGRKLFSLHFRCEKLCLTEILFQRPAPVAGRNKPKRPSYPQLVLIQLVLQVDSVGGSSLKHIRHMVGAIVQEVGSAGSSPCFFARALCYSASPIKPPNSDSLRFNSDTSISNYSQKPTNRQTHQNASKSFASNIPTPKLSDLHCRDSLKFGTQDLGGGGGGRSTAYSESVRGGRQG